MGEEVREGGKGKGEICIEVKEKCTSFWWDCFFQTVGLAKKRVWDFLRVSCRENMNKLFGQPTSYFHFTLSMLYKDESIPTSLTRHVNIYMHMLTSI